MTTTVSANVPMLWIRPRRSQLPPCRSRVEKRFRVATIRLLLKFQATLRRWPEAPRECLLDLLRGLARKPHDRRSEPYYWLREKITSIVVSTSTGSPFNKVGLYFHCCTASIAARTNNGWPEMTSRDSTEPLLEMIACKRTVPEMRVCRASGGYTG